MAEISPPNQAMENKTPTHNVANGKTPQPRGPPLHQIYALPAPIKTFPLPTFYPNNPISIIHIAYAWLGQLFRPPPAEPSVVHTAVWSEMTTSVHVTNERSVRALWEQGFYGKGNLSRSEPNWLKREQVRKGLEMAHVSELQTLQRREERARAKWERARLEQEAIRQTRQEEADRQAAAVVAAVTSAPSIAPVVGTQTLLRSTYAAIPPTGPFELLALPNSAADLSLILAEASHQGNVPETFAVLQPSEIEDLESKNIDVDALLGPPIPADTIVEPSLDDRVGMSTGIVQPSEVLLSPTGPEHLEPRDIKRRKSVRFSPQVESTTFDLADPPSPKHIGSPPATPSSQSTLAVVETPEKTAVEDIVNKEHLQLMPEEAFFLSFGLGVLNIIDPLSGLAFSNHDLLTLFRQHSYFPPRWGPDEPDLEPDDEFLLHYVVYHHFRSLGWVPRAGIKFGVDWLLYTRGPVFDHAEFGIVIIPSYTHPYWQNSEKRLRKKTWQWFHSVLRVLSHVMKSVVLVYVDVPPPATLEKNLDRGISAALGSYTIREVMIKRWSSNRNR